MSDSKPTTWADTVDLAETSRVIEDWATRQNEPPDETEPATVAWERVIQAENVNVFWSPEDGLRIAYWCGYRVTTVRFDEQGQQAIRNALGQ